jgi:monoamine oxidase
LQRAAGSGKLGVNLPETMPSLSRRSFLAASAAAAARPTLAAPAPQSDFDVIIVGAGAAGIAAARRIASNGRSFALLEASERVGGRCFTDMRSFGVPFDRGAHWLHMPDLNPVARLSVRTGLDLYPAPPGQRLRIGLRNARESEMEDFLANLVRCNRAINDAARRADVSCEQALPKDLGDWRSTLEFLLGPYGCGKPLSEVSAVDFAKSAERDVDAFCRQGLGTLLAKLAAGLPVQLSSPVTRILWDAKLVEVETPARVLHARTAIVTPSTGVLASGAIKFQPGLPRRAAEAIGRLSLGSYDHVAIEFSGNPLGLQTDDLVFEKAAGARTAALLANVSGSRLCLVELAGQLGASLAEAGEAAMTEFAIEWLAGLFGPDVKRAVERTHATRWSKERWALGAFSAAAPGGQWARRTLSEPLEDHLWFAGEAVHETLWGTLGGAWEAGERAADAALKRLARK